MITVNTDVEEAIEEIRLVLDWLIRHLKIDGYANIAADVAMQRATAVHALNRLRTYTRPADSSDEAATLTDVDRTVLAGCCYENAATWDRDHTVADARAYAASWRRLGAKLSRMVSA